MSRLARVRSALLPFVHRSLRGRRLRRVGVLSLVFTLVATALASWIALDDSPVAREAREALRVERPLHERAFFEFREFTFTDTEHARMTAAYQAFAAAPSLRENPDEDDRTTILRERTRSAVDIAGAAIASWDPARHAAHADTVARLRAQRDRMGPQQQLNRRTFDWNDPKAVALLQRLADDGFIPTVTRYRSPLSLQQAIALVAAFACGLLGLLLTVVGPVLVGIAAATEVHENTLQPLSGSALDSREIALGLVAGALAPIALIAAPLLGLACVGAAIAGATTSFLAFVGLLLANGFAAAMASLTVALHAGRRRGPGAVGMSLFAVLGTWGLVGLPLGFAPVGNDEAAALTVLQSGGMVHLVRDALLGASIPTRFALAPRFAVGALATVVVGVLALRAAERRIPGRFVASLRPVEAMLGALTLTAVTMVAASSGRSIVAAWATMAAMIMPLQVLLMARVPTGDAPTGRMQLGLRGLAVEYAGWIGLHLLAMVLVFPATAQQATWFGGLAVAWAIAVAGLAAIRVVAAPARLPTMVLAGVAFLAAIAAFFQGVDAMRSASQIRVTLAYFHPVLQLAVAVLAVGIPTVLAWPLVPRRRAGAVTA
ncbi:MAG: hypothetical protein K1X88_23490 [Nannocystaceae bacterium]|nr:hypothetical protein [Nannocystaceae bacterium]